MVEPSTLRGVGDTDPIDSNGNNKKKKKKKKKKKEKKKGARNEQARCA